MKAWARLELAGEDRSLFSIAPFGLGNSGNPGTGAKLLLADKYCSGKH